MRLSDDQGSIIKEEFRAIFGPDDAIYLFGSRVGDDAVVHEYIESVDEMALVLEKARHFTGDSSRAFRAMREVLAKAGMRS